MAENLIISVSGMRGIVGEDLTPDRRGGIRLRVRDLLRAPVDTGGRPFAVCIGRDSRVSGQMVMSAVTAGLCSRRGQRDRPGAGHHAQRRDHGQRSSAATAAWSSPPPTIPSHTTASSCCWATGWRRLRRRPSEIRRTFLGQAFPAMSSSDRCGKVTSNTDTDEVHVEKVLADRGCRADRRPGVSRSCSTASTGRAARHHEEAAGRAWLQGQGGQRRADGAVCPRAGADGGEPDGPVLASRKQEPRPTWALPRTRMRTGWRSSMRRATYIGEEYTLALAAQHVSQQDR